MQLHGFPGRDETIWALVPVKELALTKQRLRPCLGTDRSGLSLAMLTDLLRALSDSREIDRVAIVTADDQIRKLGETFGAHIVNETESTDMNQALELGRGKLREQGVDRIAVFPGDLPLATGREIDRLIREIRSHPDYPRGTVVGICPSRDRDGTNLLCIDARMELAFAYGPGSFERHRQMARARSGTVVTLSSRTVSLDIDERSDLVALVAQCRSDQRCQATETWHYLVRNDYIGKINTQDTMQQ